MTRHATLLAQTTQNLEAIHARQHDVEHDQIVTALQRLLEPCLPS